MIQYLRNVLGKRVLLYKLLPVYTVQRSHRHSISTGTDTGTGTAQVAVVSSSSRHRSWVLYYHIDWHRHRLHSRDKSLFLPLDINDIGHWSKVRAKRAGYSATVVLVLQ